jgi:hypothetical protein
MLFSYTVDYSNNPIMIVSRKKDKKKEKALVRKRVDKLQSILAEV